MKVDLNKEDNGFDYSVKHGQAFGLNDDVLVIVSTLSLYIAPPPPDIVDVVLFELNVTESNIMPDGFSENTEEMEDHDDEQNETNTININEINDTNTVILENVVEDAIAQSTSQAYNAISRTTQSTAISGYSNLTVTVSLQTNKPYYIWIKDSNKNVDVQSFSISK